MQSPHNVTDTVTDSSRTTLRGALASGTERLQPSPTAKRDAELLLMRAADCNRTFVLTHPEHLLSNEEAARFAGFLERRAAAEPIQYILGEQEFFGLRFELTPDVLIPRPETEHLVEAALARLPRGQPLRIADVGTGSGAIAVALAHSLPLAQITAIDISQAALLLARRNAEQHHVADRITFVQSDLLSEVEGHPLYDAIVSNPPYVADSEQLELQVRDFEPHWALFAGPTGLEIYERLIPQAAAMIKTGGWLLLEIGSGQQTALEQLLSTWNQISFIPDLHGISRVVAARLPES